MNATPWSAATTISDLSHMPSSLRWRQSSLQLEVGEAGLEEVALEQHVQLALVLVRLVRQAGDRVVRLAPVRRPSGRYCHGTCGISVCLKFRLGPACPG